MELRQAAPPQPEIIVQFPDISLRPSEEVTVHATEAEEPIGFTVGDSEYVGRLVAQISSASKSMPIDYTVYALDHDSPARDLHPLSRGSALTGWLFAQDRKTGEAIAVKFFDGHPVIADYCRLMLGNEGDLHIKNLTRNDNLNLKKYPEA